MQRTQPLVTAPRGRPNLALQTVKRPVVDVNGADWTLTISRDHTIVEMANLMAQFKCHATILPSGDALLWPHSENSVFPTATEVATFLERGPSST